MIGDVLLLGEKHDKATRHILKQLEDKELKKFVVAIGGESGSGKSEVAHLLRVAYRKKGIRSKILHTDNYYKTSPSQRTEWRKKHGIEDCVGLNEYKWGIIGQHLEDFKNGRSEVVLPFLDIVTDQEDKLITSFKDIDVLILEGLYAINSDGADYRVLLDLTFHMTKDTQKLRGKEPQNLFRARVLEAEHLAVQSIRHKADLVVSKEMMGIITF